MSDNIGNRFVDQVTTYFTNDSRTFGGSAITKTEFESLKAEYKKLNGLAQVRVSWELSTQHQALAKALDLGKDYNWFMDRGGRQDGQVQDYKKCH